MRECGRVSTYNTGCRCDDCRAASAKARRDSRTRNGHRKRKPVMWTSGNVAVDEDVRWMDLGACSGAGNAEFFRHYESQSGPAKAICATCDVRPTCLAFALRTAQPAGIWGGLTTDERLTILRSKATA